MSTSVSLARSKAIPAKADSESVAGYKVVGVTKDGVRILKSKGRATHFTAREIRDAVATARATRTAKSIG